jgi:hypothetical protein
MVRILDRERGGHGYHEAMRHRHAISIAMSLGMSVAPAAAQNALDANLHASGGKVNPTSQQQDYRARNLVVTGDVAGGRGFRGNVGYTAETDFRGATGGDSSYDFRAASALSNPNLVRSGSAADAFSVTRDAAALEFRRDFVGPSSTQRTGAAATAAGTRQRLDLLNADFSPSRQLTSDTLSTPMLRYASVAGDSGALTVSTVRGIKRESDRNRHASDRLGLYQAALLRKDIREGRLSADAVRAAPASPFMVEAPRDAVNVRSTRAQEPPTRGELAGQSGTTYDRVLEQIRDNWRRSRPSEASATAVATEPQSRLDEVDLGAAYEALRQKLDRGAKPSTPTRAPAAPDDSTDTPAEDGKLPGINMTIQEYAQVLEHGTEFNAFAEDPDGQDRLNQLLSTGRAAMHEGDTFLAEKQFEVALLLKPGDPRATAGMLHCQVGANLPGAAAITLRGLFTEHPEMMDVSYAAPALPPTERLQRCVASTRDLVRLGRKPADYGLLLAYLGHLLRDPVIIREGLVHVTGSAADDTMAELLRHLWLESGGSKTPEPAAAPEAAGTP